MLLDAEAEVIALDLAVSNQSVLLLTPSLRSYLISLGPLSARNQLAVVVGDARLVGYFTQVLVLLIRYQLCQRNRRFLVHAFVVGLTLGLALAHAACLEGVKTVPI